MDDTWGNALVSLVIGAGMLAWAIRAFEDSLKYVIEERANGWRLVANGIFVLAITGSLLGLFQYGDGPNTLLGLYVIWGACQIGLLTFAIGVNQGKSNQSESDLRAIFSSFNRSQRNTEKNEEK